jgi:hypothetical protein
MIQRPQDGAQARRALGVSRAGIVLQAGGMGV